MGIWGGKSRVKPHALGFCWVPPSVQRDLVLTGNFLVLSRVWFWFDEQRALARRCLQQPRAPGS